MMQSDASADAKRRRPGRSASRRRMMGHSLMSFAAGGGQGMLLLGKEAVRIMVVGDGASYGATFDLQLQ